MNTRCASRERFRGSDLRSATLGGAIFMGIPFFSDKSDSLSQRVIVSLKVGGFFFAVANVICVLIITNAWLSVRKEPRTLQVTGSAKKLIISDRIAWSGMITTRSGDLVQAYDQIKSGADKARAYLLSKGIPEKDVTFSAISTIKRHKKIFVPGKDETRQVETNEIEQYELRQWINVDSGEMEKIPAAARGITDLIKEGVEVESGETRYLYSKLSELKIDMLAEATRDATTRASQIVTNANGKLGKLVEARMGVMQINPKGVTDVSAEGNNDTTSLEKEITAVVSVRFELP